jgi:ketosteroid isomerase-like protein
MSQENEALVREAYEAYNRGDTAQLLELIHPGVEWTYLDPADADPQPQVCHGRDQFAWALSRQAEQGLKSEVEEIAAGGDKVLVVARTPGVDQHRAWRNGDHNILVLTLADGQVVAMRAFRDRDQARRFADLD